jgi:1,3-propanediol dehydrogenase
MAQASLEAGMAFSNTILGATHAMSHQVGGLLDAPHGVLNGVLLPHVIRFNAEADPTRFVSLAAAAGLRTESIPADEVALEFAEWTRRLADSVGMPKGLSALGVTEQHVRRLAGTTLKDANMTTNPRDATVADIEALFYAAL